MTYRNATISIGIALFLSVVSRMVAQDEVCDRACLNGIVDSYLEAIVAHDPARAPIAGNAKSTENTVELGIGKGLWQTASEVPASFRIYVPDPVVQQVGFFGVLKESGKPVLLALRLKVENRRITEIEQFAQRDVDDYTLPNLVKPRASFLTAIPAEKRMSRGRMLEVAKLYYESIVQNNGDVAPYAGDCERHENGLQTTSNPSLPQALADWNKIFVLGCGAQMSTRALSYIEKIDDRRVTIADPETGLVFGLCIFRRPEEQHTIKIVGIPGLDTMNRNFPSSSRHWAHIFKIQDNQIHEIEAMGGIVLPLTRPNGW
jgi:hypothetical protein